MITGISKSFQRKKSGKRLLSGLVAITLIFATLLSDFNIAYGQTGNGDLSNIAAENGNVAVETEAPADEEKKDSETDENKNETVENSETENAEDDASEGEDTSSENAEDETSEGEDTPSENVDDTVTDDKSEDDTATDEVSTDDSENSENEEEVVSDVDEENLETEVAVDIEDVAEKSKSEEKQLEEATEKMPAISIVKTVEDYEISLECREGTFAEGTTVEIVLLEDKEKEEVDKLVEEAITEDIDIIKTVSFDITFHDKDGKVVEPADKNSVSVKIVPSKHDKDELKNADALCDEELLCSVFHVEDDKNVEEIDCEVVDPIEEIIFKAESFSVYEIVWYTAEGGEDPEGKGPQEIGDFIKSRHTFINFNLPLSFTNEGTPADTSLRPEKLEFEVYGKDTTAFSSEDVLICKVTVPIQNYNKTVSLKESGKSQTEIPVYVRKGTQAQEDKGNGKHETTGFEYTVKFTGTGDVSVYTISQDTTGINVTSVINHAEWSGEGTDTLIAERKQLESKKFYVCWVDNRNNAGKRPYSTNDDFTDEDAKTAFKNSIKLYRQVGDGIIEQVTDDMVPTATLADAGPVVGRKGLSISDWEISYNNLPAVTSDGTAIKYYITVDDPTGSYAIEPAFGDWYSPEDFSDIDVAGVSKKAILEGNTGKYIYSEYFKATVQWYDKGNEASSRLTKETLSEEFVITDELGNIIVNAEKGLSNLVWTKTDGDEWEFKVGPLPMFNEEGGEKSYQLVLKDGVITAKDGTHEYSVDYSNGTKATSHEYCLSDGKIILVIDRALDSFKIEKTWADGNNQDSRKEAIESGVRFLLWRYPETKQDGTVGTPADRAAVFNPETHTQYSYTLKMNDGNVTSIESDGITRKVKDSIDITLAEFGVTTAHPVDMYDQYGHKYIYYATEVITKSGYKTAYSNVAPFDDEKYSKYGVMNGGTMTNVRQEKMKMRGIVKWNTPAVNDYTKTSVTIELQKYEDGNWVTVKGDDDKDLTKELSGFTVTNSTKSYVFPDVERYDENGEEIEYRIVQTKVSYSGTDINIENYSPKTNPGEFISDVFVMNAKDYLADVVPTPDEADSYTIENRLAGDMELVLTKLWTDALDEGFGLDGCTPYQNITINVYQHGVSADYSNPYMTITTNGTVSDDEKGTYFKTHGIEANIDAGVATEKDIPFTITYRPGLGKTSESGVIRVATTDKYDDGRANRWEFKKVSGETLSNIFLPAFNENGNAYSYTIEEVPVTGAYTTYSYERKGNELDANVTNKYATGGSNVRTVIFQKEWIDGTDIPQEKPLRFAIVRVNENGEFYYTDAGKTEIDLKDNFGDKHIITLTDNNNWYNQLSINLGKTKIIDGVEKNCFDSIEGEGGSERYLYTAIELDMSLGGTDDFSREVNYNKASIASLLKDDIENTSTCSEFRGSIDAYLDASHEENHLPGYDVTVKSANDTTSVIDATKYVAVNKRKGIVNVIFRKDWHDGNNSEGTRDGEFRVYVYQNGKKVVKTDATSDSEVKIDSLKITIDGVEKADTPAEIVYPVADKDTPVISFEGLPQYDNDGNIYNYTVKEFLVKDGNELEIALTDTKDSTKTGYVVTDHFEETHFKVNDVDKTILERNSTYEYTNTVTGEKTGGAKFYVLWHDQTIYDKGKRPDVNCILYYKVKGSDQTPQVYKGEYKLEWHPMPDTGTEKDPSDASRYYQYANFTKLPLANDEGEPYEYFAVPSLNNPGEHYDELYYESYEDVIVADGILTSAGKHHYDMAPGAAKLPDGSNMLPEDGVVEYIIDELVHVEGVKIWKLDDNGNFDKSKLPDAKVFLWRENDHDKQYSENIIDNPAGNNCGETTLNDDKTGYAFKDDAGKYIEFPKYDEYGLIYDYSVSEKIFITSSDESQKYRYSIPSYVMEYQRITNGITNVYNPVDESGKHNLRKITIAKEWEGSIDKNPIAEFGLYRIEIPLKNDYYTASVADNVLNPNPTKAAYKYAIEEFNKFKANPKTSAVKELGVKTIKYVDGATDQAVVWDDMPIFAPSGLVYLYFAEELNKHGIESFKYGVMTEASGTRPDVNVIDAVDTNSSRTNVLINYDDSTEAVRAGAVLFSNYGLDPSQVKDYVNGSSVHVNWQEAGYKNEFKDEIFGKIVGYKEWNDGIFADKVRPKIDDEDIGISLKLYRSAATQTGHGNQVTSVEISPDNYDIKWETTADPNKWKFEITPKDGITDEFKLYSTNGRPYTYTVTESISGTTLMNYKIANKSVTGSVAQVEKITETDSVMTLQSSIKNELKGKIRVYKKWDDALDEHRLRTDKVKVLLQYRMVKETSDPYVAGTYNDSNPPEISKWEEYGTYILSYGNHWAQTVERLPVKSETIDGNNYRYEYRLLETEFVDMGTTLYPVDVSGSGAGQEGSVPINKVPNGGFCTDTTSEDDRETLYGNSTNPEYKNKYYEIEIGNYHVNNSAIAALQINTSSISNMDLFVDNRLSKKTILKIEKKWEGVNAGEPEVKILDSYGILPDSLTFKIEYKEQDGDWKPLYKDGTIEPVLVTVKKYIEEDAEDSYAGYVSYVHTVESLPVEKDGKSLVYRAIELKPDLTKKDNLGRFEFSDDIDGYPKHIHVPAHTTVTNKLESRDITIRKRWNAEEELRKSVTVELWSDNFTTSKDEFSLVKNTTKTLEAANGWEVTYNNLPKYNTEHKIINYYVKESKVSTFDFSENDYAIHFFDQRGESDYYEVTDRYGTNANIAPVHKDAYEMYIVNTPKTSLNVIKNWEDEENRQGSRANVNVNVTVSDNDVMMPETKQLKTTQGSQVTWNYLPIYKKPDINFVKGSADHTDKVNYTIKESDTLKTTKGYKTPEYSFGDSFAISDSGYTINLNSGSNSATITNTYNPPKIKFIATKKWADEENRHYSRPLQKGIYVTLYYSTDNKTWKKVDEKLSVDYEGKNYPKGSKVYTLSNITQHITDNGGDTWGDAVWEGLPTKVSNSPIYYKAFETDENGTIKVTSGYSATYSPESVKVSEEENGSTVSQEITNTLERTSMLVHKEWGNTYAVKDRPDAISFVIEYKCGNSPWEVYKNTDGTVLMVTLTGSNYTAGSANVWEKKVANLPSLNSEGIKYEYRVKEVSVTYDGNEIYADGVSVETVSSELFTQDGESWKSESTVGAFKDSVVTSPSGSSEYSYRVAAVNTPIVGTLTVVKKWDDEGNRDNIRPDEIKLQLYRRQNEETPVKYGEPVVVGSGKDGTTVSTDKNEWRYTFNNLPVYNNDANEHTDENKSIYFVKEVDSKHEYEVTYVPEMGTATVEFDSAHNVLLRNSSGDIYSTSETIINKHNPVRIKIGAKKEWTEGVQKFRPESVKVKLQYCIAGEEDWKDVSVVASQSDLDKSGTKVETTSILDRILKGTSEADIWEEDENGNSVIWENLPAYVNNGKKVKYRLFEYDDTPDGQKISDHYIVVYEHCEYDAEYDKEYVLKAQNIIKDMGGILTVDKKWQPDSKDDIAQNDKIISEIQCHLEYKSKAAIAGEWEKPDWGKFVLSHSDNWQHTIVHELTAGAVYKVVEDAIVYKDKETGTEVTVDANGNKVGSFEWHVTPEIINADGENAQMQATITNSVIDNSITVSKTWLDENNRDGLRTHSIKVRLLRDGQPVGEDIILFPKIDKADSPWDEYTWHNLPVYKNGVLEDGKLVKSEYTVEEIVDSEFSEAYKISYTVDNGEDKDACDNITFNAGIPRNAKVAITNLHETHKKTIVASKNWKDENNKHSTRPKKPFGSEYHTYLMLLYKLNDVETSKWAPVNYYPDYDDFEKRGCQYPDHHIYTTSPVIQEITGNDEENWDDVATWENVSTRGVDDTPVTPGPDTAAEPDRNVSFMVIEVPGLDYDFINDSNNSKDAPKSIAPAGYRVEAEPDILNPEEDKVIVEFAKITNILITTSLDVEKTWEDQEDKYKTRPEKIRVKLERRLKGTEDNWSSVKQSNNDEIVIELSATDNWKGSFNNLPLYDNKRNEFEYRAVETALIFDGNDITLSTPEESDGKLIASGGNYVSIMENVLDDSNPEADTPKFKLSLTNRLKDEGTTSLTVNKKWKDENNRDRLRPDSISLNLLKDGVKVDTATIYGTDWNAHTWEKLPLYKNSATEKSVYTVEEEPVAGYETVITKPSDDEHTEITNTHIPKKAVITADKVWEDSENVYSTRPKEICLRLLYKYAGESDSEYRIVPEYPKETFDEDGMYTSKNAEGVFTTSSSTQKHIGNGESWTNAARWENLPLTATPDGSEYEPKTVIYKVIEVKSLDAGNEINTSEAVAGYEVTDVAIEGNNLNTEDDNRVNITNHLVTTGIDITKAFKDEDNRYNTRPDSIEVQVLRRIKKSSGDGEWNPVKVKNGQNETDLIVTLTKDEAFSKKLLDLPKYDEDGNEYEYSCLEKNLIFGSKKISADKSNSTASYSVSGNNIEIKNTLITTSLTVTKIWDDNSNARGARPKNLVFSVEQKKTENILSSLISELTHLFTGEDGYSELKMLNAGGKKSVEIIVEGPEFDTYILEGLPAYSEDGHLYSYRAIETKLVYEDREVIVEKESSLYEKPVYELDVVETGKDSKGNKAYKFCEKVVNKIIPIRKKPKKKHKDNPKIEDTEPTPESPAPFTPVPVNPNPVTPIPGKPIPKYEIIDDTDPIILPKKVTDKIYELIDLPDDEIRKDKVAKLYRDLLKIIQDDPTFIDKLDEETADIVMRFLKTGVLGRRRTKLPKTGGVVGSVMALLFSILLIGLGVAIRPADESDEKKKAQK